MLSAFISGAFTIAGFYLFAKIICAAIDKHSNKTNWYKPNGNAYDAGLRANSPYMNRDESQPTAPGAYSPYTPYGAANNMQANNPYASAGISGPRMPQAHEVRIDTTAQLPDPGPYGPPRLPPED